MRLEGIDTPERAQSFGRKAGQALAKKVFGKEVQIDDLGKGRYGRTLGIVRLGKRSVNLELVQDGWAWWYRKYAPKNKELAKAVTIYGASQTLTRNLRTSALAAATYSR